MVYIFTQINFKNALDFTYNLPMLILYCRCGKIEVRIVHKSFVRDTSAGKVFDLTLMDETASIRMTVFENVTGFNDLVSNLKVI